MASLSSAWPPAHGRKYVLDRRAACRSTASRQALRHARRRSRVSPRRSRRRGAVPAGRERRRQVDACNLVSASISRRGHMRSAAPAPPAARPTALAPASPWCTSISAWCRDMTRGREPAAGPGARHAEARTSSARRTRCRRNSASTLDPARAGAATCRSASASASRSSSA